MWKDFLYFTKTERQGILVLVVFIIGVFSAPLFFHPQEANPEEDTKFEEEYNTFLSSLKETKSPRKSRRNFSQAYPPREIKLTRFDPNTADSLTFLSLGLPPWMAKNILHYRRKQGKFRRPEDFRKIYGLTEEQYQTLSPYIRIAEAPHLRDTLNLLAQPNTRPDTLIKYPAGTIIDLNQADTTELKKIPHIGSAIARKIINYRKRLGAFYRIEQLGEINLKVEMLRAWFSVDSTQIHRININKASIERMMYHPYINFYQAKAIAEYRKKKGPLKSLKQLSLYEEFTEEDFERIAPYICYE